MSSKLSNKLIRTDVAIIGAGPAGLYAAYLLAENTNLKITVFEEHNKIGLPVKCTGLVTNSIQKIIKLPQDIIKNKIEFAHIISQRGDSIEIKLKDQNLVLDRAKFDQFLAKKAIDSGVNILLNHKFYCLENREDKTIILKNKHKNILCRTSYLIGADGPQSIINKIINPKKNIDYLIGMQARVNIDLKSNKNKQDKSTIKFYPINKGFGWFVPESDNIVRIGVASYTNLKQNFDSVVKRYQGNTRTEQKIIDYQAGLIPIYTPGLKTYKKIQKIHTYVIGDAATQVKATTAGGIIQSLLAAKALCKSIKYRKNYSKLLQKSLTKDTYLHLIIRKILDNFSDKDYDYLFKLTNQPKIKEILSNHDRDFILKLTFKMFLKEPRYLYFLKNII